jgi:hypothetical protein
MRIHRGLKHLSAISKTAGASPANVSIRIRQQPSAYAYVSGRQHTHTSTTVSIRIRRGLKHLSAISKTAGASPATVANAYVSNRQHTHTSATVSMRIRRGLKHLSAISKTAGASPATVANDQRIVATSCALKPANVRRWRRGRCVSTPTFVPVKRVN